MDLFENTSSLPETRYRDSIRSFVELLKRASLNLPAMVLGTFLSEPLQALRAGVLCPFGWMQAFHFHNLNPHEVAEEHKSLRPILLIHGDYHNQSAWLTLASFLKRENIGPVYTVNLPNGPITDVDYRILNKKVDEIIKKHPQKIQIDIVGHSRGGDIAYDFALQRPQDIRKVIKMGSILTQENLFDSVYEISAHYDVLETNPSQLPKKQHLTVPTGHLGLIFSDKVLKQIIQWLK